MTKVGVATGAARGMGHACAAQMADLVDVLLLVDRDRSGAESAAASLAADTGVTTEPVVMDVTDEAAVRKFASDVGARGSLRAVSHAAGISPSMGDWRQILSVDLVGTALMVDALFPLAAPGTAIVCFGSMAPFLSPSLSGEALEVLSDPLSADFAESLFEAVGSAIEDPGMAYAWAKLGVHRLVRREAVRFGTVGGRICSLSPGLIETPMGELEFGKRPSKTRLLSQVPLGRTGTSEEIAAAVRFLLSDEASYINGIDLLVDGGVCAALGAS